MKQLLLTIVIIVLHNGKAQCSSNFYTERVKPLTLFANAGYGALLFSSYSACAAAHVSWHCNKVPAPNSCSALTGPGLAAPTCYTTKCAGSYFLLAETALHLNASEAAGDVRLSWTIIPYVGTGYFLIERSADSVNWKAIGKLKENNATGNYAFTDKTALPGKNYYRVNQVNIPGSNNYSNIVSIDAWYCIIPAFRPSPQYIQNSKQLHAARRPM